MIGPDDPDDGDEGVLDDVDDLVWPDEPRNPLDGYGTPATRLRKPNATGRDMHDVLPTL